MRRLPAPVSPTSESAASAATPVPPRPPPVKLPAPASAPASASASSVAKSLAPKPTLPATLAIAPKTFPAQALSPSTLSPAVLAVKPGASQDSILKVQIAAAQTAALQSVSIPPPSQLLDATQLQALPLPGRNWQSFVLDAPAPAYEAGERREAAQPV